MKLKVYLKWDFDCDEYPKYTNQIIVSEDNDFGWSNSHVFVYSEKANRHYHQIKDANDNDKKLKELFKRCNRRFLKRMKCEFTI